MKELEDFEWFPQILRQYQTEFIGFVVARFNVYAPFINYLNNDNSRPDKLFDLCSGSGEPAISIFKALTHSGDLTLSDKFPSSVQTSQTNISYIQTQMDVLTLNFNSNYTYTMFNAFHHFNKDEQMQIVSKIKSQKASAYFVEILSPNILFYLKVLTMTTLGTLLFTPFIKPFSIKRLFFTYLLPINLFTITYDGLVSVYKSKSVKQYRNQFNTWIEPTDIFELKKGLFSLIVIKIKP